MSASGGNVNLETTVTNRQAYKVEKIIGVHMGESNETFYKVQWSPTWEPLANLLACKHLIDEFWKSRNPNFLGTSLKNQDSPSSTHSSIISLENGFQTYETVNDTPVTTKAVKNLSKKSSIIRHPFKQQVKDVSKKLIKSSCYKKKLRLPQVHTEDSNTNSIKDYSHLKNAKSCNGKNAVLPNDLLLPANINSTDRSSVERVQNLSSTFSDDKEQSFNCNSNQFSSTDDMTILRRLSFVENNEVTSIKKTESRFASPKSAFIAVSIPSASSRSDSVSSTRCESEGSARYNSEVQSKLKQDNGKKIMETKSSESNFRSQSLSEDTNNCSNSFPLNSYSMRSFDFAPNSMHSEPELPSKNFETGILTDCPGSISPSSKNAPVNTSMICGKLHVSASNEPVNKFIYSSDDQSSFCGLTNILKQAKKMDFKSNGSDAESESFKSAKVSKLKKVVKCPFCTDVAYVVNGEKGLTSFNNHLYKKHALEENVSGLEDFIKCPMCVKHYKNLRSCVTHLNFAHSISITEKSLDSGDRTKGDDENSLTKNWNFTHLETSNSSSSFTKDLKPVLSLDPIIPISSSSRNNLDSTEVSRKLSNSVFSSSSSPAQPTSFHKEAKACQNLLFQCPQCGVVLSSRKEFSEHVRIHLDDFPSNHTGVSTLLNKKRFDCSICGLAHSSNASLKRHTKLRHESSFPCSTLMEETFKCPLCPEERRTYHHLLVHLQTRHSKWSPLKTTNNPRNEIKRTMTTLRRRVIKSKLRYCTLCHKSFTNRFAFSRHYALCHKNLSGNKSSFRILSKRSKVEKAVKSEKYVCNKCSSVFTDKKSYAFHKRSHRSDYSQLGFECLTCAWQSKWRSTILGHVRNFHPEQNEKSFINLKDKECALDLPTSLPS